MDNLENLEQKILSDARVQAEQILKKAGKKRQKMIQKKIAEAEEINRKLMKRAEEEAKLKKDRILSNAKIKIRDEQLKAKQEIIDQVFSVAKKQLVHLEGETYSRFLLYQLTGLELTGTEVLIIPENQRHIVEKLNLPVKVADDESIPSGFILKGDNKMLNCSFDFLLDYYRDELELTAARVLFESGG